MMFVFANCSISFQVHHSMSELMSVGCVSVFYFILLLQNVLLCLAIASSQLPSVVTFIIPFHRWCSPTFQIIHDLFCCLTRVIVRPLCALERVTERDCGAWPGLSFCQQWAMFVPPGSLVTMFTPDMAAWSLVTNTEAEGKMKILLFPELNYYFHGRDDQCSHPWRVLSESK